MSFQITNFASKRSTTESASSEQLAKRKKTNKHVDVIDYIKIRQWSKLWQKLEQAEIHCDFNDKIGQLQGRCKVIDKTTCSMWIEFNHNPSAQTHDCTYLFFTLTKGAFKSENIADELLGVNRKNKNKFYQLTLNELNEKEEQTELLKLLISPKGDKGELEWISKGEKFTGKEILSIFERMQKYLAIQTLYLYDDATFSVRAGKGNAKPAKLPVHVYLPVAAKNGLPFYASWANFKILECHDIPCLQDKEIIFSQNAEVFNKAVTLIKNTKINKDFRDQILKRNPKWQSKVDVLIRKIEGIVPLKKCTTVGSLFTKLNTALREKKYQANTHQIALLLQESINLFFNYTAVCQDSNARFIQAYEEAINILEFTRIFVRRYEDVV